MSNDTNDRLAAIEIVEAARPYYGRMTDEDAISDILTMIEEWDYESDKHGYCHTRSMLLQLVHRIARGPVDQPKTLRFVTQDALEDYVETQLNEKGHDPTVALIDSRGVQTTAHRTAPGGDGYDFQFAVHDREPDSGMIHCHECSECEHSCGTVGYGWVPAFPVWIFEAVR